MSAQSSIGVQKGHKQGDYCVSYYALVKEPVNSVYGMFLNVGNYDTLEEAEKEASRIRLNIKCGGRVLAHRTGYVEPLLGEERPHGKKKKISEDLSSIYNLKAQEQAEKERRERAEIERKRREALEEQEEDPTSLDYYARLQFRVKMLKDSITLQEQNLATDREKLLLLSKELEERTEANQDYEGKWVQHLQETYGVENLSLTVPEQKVEQLLAQQEALVEDLIEDEDCSERKEED